MNLHQTETSASDIIYAFHSVSVEDLQEPDNLKMTSRRQLSFLKKQPHGSCYVVLNQQFTFEWGGGGRDCIKEN